MKYFKIFTCLLIFIYCSFIFVGISFAVDDVYVWSNMSDNSVPTSTIFREGNFLNLTCGSAILIEQKTGQVLYEYNSHEQLRPASVTKIMTLLLIMEALDNGSINLSDSVPCSEKASSMGGSQIWLDTRENLTVDEMIKAISIVSANDCCVAMAEFISGSEEIFVEQMNKKAKELGMNDTTFKNCHGIDEDGHLTSSYDIALMSKELMNNHPNITKYTTTWMDSLRNGQSQLVSTNKLVRNYKGCTGLKTGSTSLALFNLSATATRNDLSLIAVVMRGETSAIRFAEARKLLDYGFSNFEYVNYSNKGEIAGNINVEKGLKSNVEVIFQDNAGALVMKGQSSSINTSVTLPNSISAPVKKGDKIGEVTFSIGDKVLSSINLVANDNVKKLSFGNMLANIVGKWCNLLRKC